jgi:hypothetical protein
VSLRYTVTLKFEDGGVVMATSKESLLFSKVKSKRRSSGYSLTNQTSLSSIRLAKRTSKAVKRSTL